MRTFSITSPKWEGEILLSYNELGNFDSAKFPEVISADVLVWLSGHFPMTTDILEWVRNNSKGKITEVIKIEFIDFWNLYNKKEGSKKKAELLWDGIAKTCNKRPIITEDKLQIMQVLPRFVMKYKQNNEFQPLATTFLNERRWEALVEAQNKDEKNRPYKNELSRKLLEMWATNS